MKRLLIMVLLAALAFPALADNKPIQFTLGNWLWKPAAAVDLTSCVAVNGTRPLTATWAPAYPILFPDGAVGAPSIAFASDTDTGIYYAASTLGAGAGYYFVTGGVYNAAVNQNGITIESGKAFLFSDGTRITLEDSNIIQFNADAAAPADFVLKAADGSGADKPGASFYLKPGQSTGTGVSGSLIGQTGYVSTTSSTKNTYYTRYHADAKVHSIDDNTATAMFSIACADGNAVGGYINYTVEVTDGTDFQVESGTFTFAAVNKATETWTTDADKGTFSQAVSASTLTVTWAVDTATADTMKVTVNSNSGLTPTSTKVQFQIFLNSPKVITIL